MQPRDQTVPLKVRTTSPSNPALSPSNQAKIIGDHSGKKRSRSPPFYECNSVSSTNWTLGRLHPNGCLSSRAKRTAVSPNTDFGPPDDGSESVTHNVLCHNPHAKEATATRRKQHAPPRQSTHEESREHGTVSTLEADTFSQPRSKRDVNYSACTCASTARLPKRPRSTNNPKACQQITRRGDLHQ